MVTKATLAFGLALLLSAWAPSGAQAQPASALVLEKSGASEPEVKPYSEMPAGATVSLSPGTKLVFVHYHTCRTVTVLGGRITFGAETYAVSGGTKTEQAGSTCPRTVRLKGSGEIVGGVVVRSVRPALQLSTTPSFVLSGARADDFAKVAVAEDGRVVLEAGLSGRFFRWPAARAPLPTTDHELILVPKEPGKARVTIRFRAEPQSGGPSGDAVTVISIEE